MVTGADPDAAARRLAADALAAGDPTGWFERLYVEAAGGTAVVPWDRGVPHALLVEWVDRGAVTGGGRRALVVGCGLGRDAEYVARLGFDTVAFDISATAVRAARDRHPGSPVAYRTADLLDPPPAWRAAFDVVVESMTVQSLPTALRRAATVQVGQFVAPGGTLLVIAAARAAGDPDAGPPWPLTRADVDAFATGGLVPVTVEDIRDATQPAMRRWRAEFHRSR